MVLVQSHRYQSSLSPNQNPNQKKRSLLMPRDILGEYGDDTPQPQVAVIRRGGILPGQTSDVNNYRPPQGPKSINDPKSPGIHGANSGTNGSQGSTSDALQRGGS